MSCPHFTVYWSVYISLFVPSYCPPLCYKLSINERRKANDLADCLTTIWLYSHSHSRSIRWVKCLEEFGFGQQLSFDHEPARSRTTTTTTATKTAKIKNMLLWQHNSIINRPLWGRRCVPETNNLNNFLLAVWIDLSIILIYHLCSPLFVIFPKWTCPSDSLQLARWHRSCSVIRIVN